MAFSKTLYKALTGNTKKRSNAPKKETTLIGEKSKTPYQDLMNLIDNCEDNKFVTYIPNSRQWYEAIRQAMEITDAAPINLFVHGITHKAEALNAGYTTLTKSGNYICAISLIRILLDCSLLAWAGLVAKNRDQFFLAYNSGTPINRLEDKEGNKLTQGYIVRTLSESIPEIKEIFDDCSSFIHTSRAAQDCAIDLSNDIRLMSYENYKTPDSVRYKAHSEMKQANNLLISILSKWVQLKHGVEIEIH